MLRNPKFRDEAEDIGQRLCYTGTDEIWRETAGSKWDPNTLGELAVWDDSGNLRIYNFDEDSVQNYAVFFTPYPYPKLQTPKQIQQGFIDVAFVPGRPREFFYIPGLSNSVHFVTYPEKAIEGYVFGGKVIPLKPHAGRVRAIEVDIDGRMLFTGDETGIVRLWPLQLFDLDSKFSKKSFLDDEVPEFFEFDAHDSPVFTISHLDNSLGDSNGGEFVTGGSDRAVKLWQWKYVKREEEYKTFRFIEVVLIKRFVIEQCDIIKTLYVTFKLDDIPCDANANAYDEENTYYSNNEVFHKRVLAVTTQGSFYVWNPALDTPLILLADHSLGSMTSLSVLPGSRIAATGDDYGVVRLYRWTIRDGTEEFTNMSVANASLAGTHTSSTNRNHALDPINLVAECPLQGKVTSCQFGPITQWKRFCTEYKFNQEEFECLAVCSKAGTLRKWPIAELPLKPADVAEGTIQQEVVEAQRQLDSMMLDLGKEAALLNEEESKESEQSGDTSLDSLDFQHFSSSSSGASSHNDNEDINNVDEEEPRAFLPPEPAPMPTTAHQFSQKEMLPSGFRNNLNDEQCNNQERDEHDENSNDSNNNNRYRKNNTNNNINMGKGSGQERLIIKPTGFRNKKKYKENENPNAHNNIDNKVASSHLQAPSLQSSKYLQNMVNTLAVSKFDDKAIKDTDSVLLEAAKVTNINPKQQIYEGLVPVTGEIIPLKPRQVKKQVDQKWVDKLDKLRPTPEDFFTPDSEPQSRMKINFKKRLGKTDTSDDTQFLDASMSMYRSNLF